MRPRNFLKALWGLWFLILAASVQSQPYRDEIRSFQKEDSLHPPKKGSILFVGSSSFRIWQDVQDYFPGYPILNRGFGGSTLEDLFRYAPEIIYPYRAHQIVIYCGDNDLASSDSVTPSLVLKRFNILLKAVREHQPRVEVLFVSIKPSPSRWKLAPRIEESNRLIREALVRDGHGKFVDVYHAMLGADGRPLPEIFRSDSLHMNPKGYAIWKKEILPFLKK